jgi:hypothetical protein
MRRHPLIRSLSADGLAAALYLAAALLFTCPLPLVAGRAIDNIGDPLLNTWILAWDWHALTTHPLGLFDANIFYPNPNTLAYSENLVFTALLAAPVNALTGNPVLAHNFVVVLSFPLTALAAYALVKHLTGSWAGALAGGFIFAFAHYRLGQLSHLQLLTGFWVPLTLLWLHRFAEEPRLRWAALAGATIGLQWWTSIYYAFYLVLAAALFAAWALATGAMRLSRRVLLGGALAAVVAGALIAPGLKPYLDIGQEVGERTLGQQEGATVSDYLRPQPLSVLGRLRGLAGGHWEHTLFPGLVALGLAGVGLARPKGGLLAPANRWKSFYLLLGVVSLLLSFGPEFSLTDGGPPLIQGMPYAWLYRAIPALAALRVPARLAVLVMLAVAALAGQGAAVAAPWLAARMSREPQRHGGREEDPVTPPRSSRLRGESSAGFLLVAALVVEYLALPVPHAPIETGAAVPLVYRWLADQQFEGAIFELPTARTSNITDDQLSIRRMARQQYFSVYHWHPLVIGYSGTNAPTFKDVIDFAPAAASPPGLALLHDLGVSRIVVHRDEMTWDEWATFAESAMRQLNLEQVAEVGESTVYAIGRGSGLTEDRWQRVNVSFDTGLTLQAYTLSGGDDYTAGEAFLAKVRWDADPQQSRGRAASLQLEDEAGQKVGQADFFFPVGGDRRPGETVEQRSIFALPRDLVPGNYRLRAIVYESDNLASVGLPTVLATLTVKQPDFLIQHPFTGQLGPSIQLVGFDADSTAQPGQPFAVTLYWQRSNPIPADYTVFVHLRRADGSVLAQQDNPPRAGTYPTSLWRDGETVLDHYALDVPADAAPGTYTLAVGMYPPGSDMRLFAYDAHGKLLPDGSLILGSVAIAP